MSNHQTRGCSSVGRALRSHRRGRGFDYHQLHENPPAFHRRRVFLYQSGTITPNPPTLTRPSASSEPSADADSTVSVGRNRTTTLHRRTQPTQRLRDYCIAKDMASKNESAKRYMLQLALYPNFLLCRASFHQDSLAIIYSSGTSSVKVSRMVYWKLS